MNDTKCYFITWTTYGTWLPGDARGWRKRRGGYQISRPQLEEWCRKQMRGEAVLLALHDREAVENSCRAALSVNRGAMPTQLNDLFSLEFS